MRNRKRERGENVATITQLMTTHLCARVRDREKKKKRERERNREIER